jgi:hypothetical protein
MYTRKEDQTEKEMNRPTSVISPLNVMLFNLHKTKIIRIENTESHKYEQVENETVGNHICKRENVTLSWNTIQLQTQVMQMNKLHNRQLMSKSVEK